MSELSEFIEKVVKSRKKLVHGLPIPRSPQEAEGGCGVVGLISTVQISGRHILTPLLQMHNRGNGKGGGVAAVGLDHEQMGVSKEILENDYLIQVAYLDPNSREQVEKEFIDSCMTVHARARIGPKFGLERGKEGVYHPEVWRYFCRAKPANLDRFKKEIGLVETDPRKLEDEFVYQNSFRLNEKYYASLGEKKAFVLSHGKNLFVFKIVGYAEEAIRYYGLENVRAHLWIGHQRYPTKGKVWHPGGAHPFVGLHEALVHNGDFANYYSIAQYLAQRNIRPLFLTDTEVSVLLFDLLRRVYDYPLEYVIEALAPTTERDFTLLPQEKQKIYRQIQLSHLHGSPDGPWFFIIGRNDPYERAIRLIGITDTSMLRPQVFAFQLGKVSIGLIASEKQAIDATLQSLAREDSRFWPIADKYWNARGGSYTDGGAFLFSLILEDSGYKLLCRDKFGRDISDPEFQKPVIDLDISEISRTAQALQRREGMNIEHIQSILKNLSQREAAELIISLSSDAKNDAKALDCISKLTMLLDRRYPIGQLRRAFVSEMALRALYHLFDSIPTIDTLTDARITRVTIDSMREMRPPNAPEKDVLIIDSTDFPAEGDLGISRALVTAYGLGWRRFIVYRMSGQRFLGSGLGKKSNGVRIDVYGSPGDYLGSGLDGAEIYVHGNAQDQVAQIMNRGKLVIQGDVGQTFMYGAKGGEAYIRGNAAGRPLINAVGQPRVVINGTALDYLAESFMAGDPMSDGGFVILNGLKIDGDGKIQPLDTPYPGGNLFSLASGGAIYVRDPDHLVGEDQLNGGQFAPFTQDDWDLIKPYLEENERLFGVSIDRDILVYNGKKLPPSTIYRKIKAVPLTALTAVGRE